MNQSKEQKQEEIQQINYQSNRILSYDQMKVHFEKIFESTENCYCFECGQAARSWASINNAIFLCLKCSEIHRAFGINISFIRSVELDCWNEKQLILLQIGGNKNLKQFFESYQLIKNIDVNDSQAVGFKYFTKAAQYYRNKINAIIEKKQVMPDPPSSVEEGQQLIDLKQQIFPQPLVANYMELYQIQETAKGEEEYRNSFFSQLIQDIIGQFSQEQYSKIENLVKKKGQEEKQESEQQQIQEEEKNKNEGIIQEEIEGKTYQIENKLQLNLLKKISFTYDEMKNSIQQSAIELENKYSNSELKQQLQNSNQIVNKHTKIIGDAVSKSIVEIANVFKQDKNKEQKEDKQQEASTDE